MTLITTHHADGTDPLDVPDLDALAEHLAPLADELTSRARRRDAAGIEPW